MKNQTCCFTGHRKIPPEQYAALARRLEQEITCLIGQGIVYFGAGGALGFDTLAAQTVLRLKKKYPQIKLILCYLTKPGGGTAYTVAYAKKQGLTVINLAVPSAGNN